MQIARKMMKCSNFISFYIYHPGTSFYLTDIFLFFKSHKTIVQIIAMCVYDEYNLTHTRCVYALGDQMTLVELFNSIRSFLNELSR